MMRSTRQAVLPRSSQSLRFQACRPSMGFSLIELLIVVAIILIIAAIAIPNMLRARISANEASAVGSLRSLIVVLVQYSTNNPSVPGCANCGYPPNLAILGPGAPPQANLIDAVLASGVKSGYTFAYIPGATDANGAVVDYTINADPTLPGTSGNRCFFTDASGVIRGNTQGAPACPATPLSPPIS